MAQGDITIKDLRWQTASFDDLSGQQLYSAMRLRQEIFVVEQNCVYNDLDGLDQSAMHILAWRGTELMAYLRCLEPGQSYPQSSVGRIVVAAQARAMSLGRELVQRGIDNNRRIWPDSGIRIAAQAYLEKFYVELGFVVDGAPFDEDGISHLHMNYMGIN
jgi:ElaA protein